MARHGCGVYTSSKRSSLPFSRDCCQIKSKLVQLRKTKPFLPCRRANQVNLIVGNNNLTTLSRKFLNSNLFDYGWLLEPFFFNILLSGLTHRPMIGVRPNNKLLHRHKKRTAKLRQLILYTRRYFGINRAQLEISPISRESALKRRVFTSNASRTSKLSSTSRIGQGCTNS